VGGTKGGGVEREIVREVKFLGRAELPLKIGAAKRRETEGGGFGGLETLSRENLMKEKLPRGTGGGTVRSQT